MGRGGKEKCPLMKYVPSEVATGFSWKIYRRVAKVAIWWKNAIQPAA
jgi:hypothetical protein